MSEKPQALVELDRHDRKRTQRERALTAAILVIGVVVALVVGYEITNTDEGVRSIKCEKGDVTLIVERADGVVDRVECPAAISVTP